MSLKAKFPVPLISSETFYHLLCTDGWCCLPKSPRGLDTTLSTGLLELPPTPIPTGVRALPPLPPSQPSPALCLRLTTFSFQCTEQSCPSPLIPRHLLSCLPTPAQYSQINSDFLLKCHSPAKSCKMPYGPHVCVTVRSISHLLFTSKRCFFFSFLLKTDPGL